MAEPAKPAETKKARSLVLVERLIDALHDRGAINDQEYARIVKE